MSIPFSAVQPYLKNPNNTQPTNGPEYGSVGRDITGFQGGGDPAQSRGYFGGQFDPRFMEEYEYDKGDSMMERAWRLNPEWTQKVGDLRQVGGKWKDRVGQPGGVKDPSLVKYDPELGWTTPTSNIQPPKDSWVDKFAFPAAFALMNPFVAMGNGLLFEGAGAAGTAGSVGSSGPTGAAGFIDKIPGIGTLIDKIPGLGELIIKNPLRAFSVINMFINGGGSNGTGGGGMNLDDLLGGGLDLTMRNRNINQFQDSTNKLWEQLMGMNPNRGPAFDLARQFMTDPESYFSSPAYQGYEDKVTEDMMRKFASKGQHFSGGEMGDISRGLQANRVNVGNNLMKNYSEQASLLNPMGAAGDLFRSYGNVFNARTNRNAVGGQLLSKMFGDSADFVGSLIKKLFSSGMSDDDVKEYIENLIPGNYDDEDWKNVMNDIIGSDNTLSNVLDDTDLDWISDLLDF